MCADDMTQDSEDTTKILLELFSEFGKITGCKRNTQRLVAFLHTNNKLSEKEIKETTALTMQSIKQTNNLGINPSKEEKDLQLKTCKTLGKKSKKTHTDGQIYHVHGLEKLILLNNHMTQGSPHQNANGIFHRNRTNNLKIFLLSSVTQSSLTLCDSMDCSTPGFSVHNQLLEFTQAHVHWVSDAIQPSHPLSSPSPPTVNLPQHQGIFKWVSSSNQVAEVLEFQLQHQSFQWIFRTDFL